jgi:predicted ATP-grasp superfamily ATP-dependent carboligase
MALGAIRSLGPRGVPLIAGQLNPRDVAQHSRYVEHVEILPDPVDSEEAFTEALLDLGVRFPGAIVISAHDAAVVAVARNRDVLSESLVVAAPEWDHVAMCIDKRLTYDFAERIGVPCPRSFTVDQMDEAVATIGFPLLVKPSQSHLFMSEFGTKMIEVTDRRSLGETLARVDESGLEVMLQEIVTGPDSAGANYNAYAKDGRVVAEFTARKVRNSPSKWGSPRVVKSEVIEEVAILGRRLLGELGYTGFACVEWKQDVGDGGYRLIEINARQNLSSTLAVRCGIDFPWIEYCDRLGLDLPEADSFEEGRYWIDFVRDAGTTLFEHRSESYGVRDYLRPYVSKQCHAHWSWKDPAPAVTRLLDAAVRGRRSTPGHH